MVVIIGGEGNDNLVGTEFDDEIDGRGVMMRYSVLAAMTQ